MGISGKKSVMGRFTEINKIVIGVSVFVILLVGGLVTLVVWATKDRPSGKSLILHDALNLSFNGKVDSVFQDKENHSAKTVILSGGYSYAIYTDWADQINLGDSLAKKKGSLYVKVFKLNGKKVILNYNELVDGLK